MPARSARTGRLLHGHPEQGASAVEFALVLPLLMLFLFGIIQYGYGFFQLQAFNSALSEAARSAAAGVTDCDAFRSEVGNLVSGNGVDGGLTGVSFQYVNLDGSVIPSGSADAATLRQSLARVTATYAPLDFNLPFVPFPDSITRSRTSAVQDIGLDLDGVPLGNCL